jgi:hypothetical protein
MIARLILALRRHAIESAIMDIDRTIDAIYKQRRRDLALEKDLDRERAECVSKLQALAQAGINNTTRANVRAMK